VAGFQEQKLLQQTELGRQVKVQARFFLLTGIFANSLALPGGGGGLAGGASVVALPV